MISITEMIQQREPVMPFTVAFSTKWNKYHQTGTRTLTVSFGKRKLPLSVYICHKDYKRYIKDGSTIEQDFLKTACSTHIQDFMFHLKRMGLFGNKKRQQSFKAIKPINQI